MGLRVSVLHESVVDFVHFGKLLESRYKNTTQCDMVLTLRLRYRQNTRFCAYITRHFVCIADRHGEHAQQQAQAKDTAHRRREGTS